MTSDELSLSDHRRLAQFMAQTVGIQLPPSKKSLVEARLRHRQLQLGFDNLGQYIQATLEGDRQEQVLMIDALTTNKTDFLREPVHFDILTEQLDTLLKRHRDLLFWSAGCSTGEEPYTLAMLLMLWQEQRRDFDFHILATDISVSCLTIARQATYPTARIDPLPMEWRKRFLLRCRDPRKDVVRMAPEVRNKITFDEFNLMQGDFARLDQFDVIFCRNVMIYFSSEQRQWLIARFHRQLYPGGLLFVGLSEGISSSRASLSQLSPSVYRRMDC